MNEKVKRNGINVLMILVGVAIGTLVFNFFSNDDSELPVLTLSVDEEMHKTIQSTYCWSDSFGGECVDMAPPPELIEDRNFKAIPVRSNGDIKLIFKADPVEDSVEVMEWSKNSDGEVVPVENNVIKAPDEKGTYIYSAFGRWDFGDSMFVFAVEVK